MYSLRVLLLFTICVNIFAETRIKIGVLSGPGSSLREGGDKFWSFARPPASPLRLEPLHHRLPKWSGTEIARAVCDAALSEARGLVVLCPRRLSPLVDAYSSRLRLPLVTPWGGQGALHAALVPDAAGAAADVVRGDASFAFLYDTDTGADHLSSVFSRLVRDGSPGPRVEGFWRVHGPNESLAFLQLAPRNTTRAIVDVADEGAADEVARLLSAAGREVHALWMGPALMPARRSSKVSGRSTLTKFQAGGGGVSLEDLENRWKTLDDGRGDEKEMPVSSILTHDAIRVMYSMLEQLGTEWLDLNSTTLADEDCFNFTGGLPEGDTLDMQTLSGSGVTGPLKFDESGYRAGYTLDVIETNSFGSKKVGTWSRSSGLRLNADRMQAEQAQGLQREVPIRVTSVINRPFLTVKPGNQLEGYIPDLVAALRNVTGRPFVLAPVKDGRYGYKVDGRWVGMIGEVIDNEADVALAPLTKTPVRSSVVTFGKTFMTTGVTVVMLKPPAQTHMHSIGPFFPFTVWAPATWAVSALLLLATGALGHAASRFIGSPDRVRALESKDELSPCGSLWHTCGALFWRDTGIYPHTLTHRALSWSWWFLCLVLGVFYVTSLTSEVVRIRTTAVSTHAHKTSQQLIHDMLREGSPILGTIRSGSTPSFFKNSQMGLYQELGRYMEARPDILVNTYSEGIRRVREGGGRYGFLAEAVSAKFEANQPPCDILLSAGYLASRSYAPATRKVDARLRDLIDHALLSLTEDGVLRDLYEKWWHNYTDYCEDPNLDLLPKVYSSSMTVYETSGIYLVLVFGSLLATVAAFVEKYVASKRVTFLE